jgi:hypothetical protein
VLVRREPAGSTRTHRVLGRQSGMLPGNSLSLFFSSSSDACARRSQARCRISPEGRIAVRDQTRDVQPMVIDGNRW